MLTVLQATFEKKLSSELEDIYWRALEDLPIEAVERAGHLALQGCKFFPKPAELRELTEGNADAKAEAAWQLVKATHAKAGETRSVIFEDGAIGAAIVRVFGGWPQLADSLHAVFSYESGVSTEEFEDARINRRVAEGRRVQVAGLSLEMIAARRKEFLSAYRTASTQGEKVIHLPGASEIENMQSAGSWTRGRELGPEITQFVCIAARSGPRLIKAQFSTETGRLLDSPARLLLEQPEKTQVAIAGSDGQKQLLKRSDQKLLSSGETEQQPEIVKELLEALADKMRMPVSKPLSPEEHARRVADLKRQAERI